MKSAPVLLLLQGGLALQTFQAKIPNGNSFPASGGLGHIAPAGGGSRNQFGLDFNVNGKVWTQAFCQLDSDGDGKTNGEELGDPDCNWAEGDVISSVGITHPGVADDFSDMSGSTGNDMSGSTGNDMSGSTGIDLGEACKVTGFVPVFADKTECEPFISKATEIMAGTATLEDSDIPQVCACITTLDQTGADAMLNCNLWGYNALAVYNQCPQPTAQPTAQPTEEPTAQPTEGVSAAMVASSFFAGFAVVAIF